MFAICQTFLLTEDRRIKSQLAAVLAGSPFDLEVFARVNDLQQAERPATALPLIIDSRHPDWRVALEQASSERANVAVMVLTRTNNSTEKIEALELGADQALCRWEDFAEVKARLAAMVRRLPIYGTPLSGPLGGTLDFAGWEFRPTERRLSTPAGRAVTVSGCSARLLMVLLTSAEPYMTIDDIQREMGARYPGRDGPATNWRLRVHRLRLTFKELEPKCEPIRHVRGKGYAFGEKLGPPT